jgi:hypothetical protein
MGIADSGLDDSTRYDFMVYHNDDYAGVANFMARWWSISSDRS